MPIATPDSYQEMIERAKKGGFAYPAINTTSSQTLNAAIQGFAEARSDGIIQVSTGGAEYYSGLKVKNMEAGALAMSAYAHEVAKHYDITIALHTDHCPKEKLDGFMRPLIQRSIERVNEGGAPWYHSHMWDGSAVPLEENLDISEDLLAQCHKAGIIMEMEIGVVGGEEDGIVGERSEKMYTAEGDFIAVAERLGLGENGRYILAATFGNVHGVYKPGNVELRPDVLKKGQAAVAKKFNTDTDKPFALVFHGGSGSEMEDIHESLTYGVIKMNIDTDCQYAFTRPIVDHMFKNYDGVVKMEGEVGNKSVYDPRSYGKKAEQAMADRVVQACEALKSDGTTMAD